MYNAMKKFIIVVAFFVCLAFVLGVVGILGYIGISAIGSSAEQDFNRVRTQIEGDTR